MKFDRDGRRIRGGNTYQPAGGDDTVVTDLGSRHPGISDSHLAIALDAIPLDKHEEFHKVLLRMEGDLGED